VTWQIDPMHTQVEFSAKHFGMMTVRGHFRDVTTTGEVDPSNLAGSHVEATIDVASLTTNNPQRDNDLRSSYFLELDKNPSITFRSTSIAPAGDNRFKLTGDLTIKGITKTLTLDVQRYGEINDERMGHRVAFSAEGQINRKDFGMEFDMLADNRLVVSHEIKIYVEAELVEQKAPVGAASA
jgi:polyisoprenoid-binding protein YceI